MLLFLTACTVPDGDFKITAYVGILLTDQDIVSYNSTAHAMTLTPEAIQRIKGSAPVIEYYGEKTTYDGYLVGEQFNASLGKRVVIEGALWSGISSMSYEGVMLSDILLISPEYPELQFGCGYPVSSLCDERWSDRALVAHFEKQGKLVG